MAALHFVYFHDKDLDFQIVNEWVIKPNVWMMALSPKTKCFVTEKLRVRVLAKLKLQGLRGRLPENQSY